MTTFVHLAPEKALRSIGRTGIACTPAWRGRPAGVYAMPVTPNFVLTHQWLRELKRRGQRTIWGVYLRVPDATPVWMGRYNELHQQMTAAEALAQLLCTHMTTGFEVLIPRAIESGEVRAVRRLPQTLGWRYFPASHGAKPCGCPACQARGEIRSQRIRRAWEA